MALQAQRKPLTIRVWDAQANQEGIAKLTRQNFGAVFSFVGMWDWIRDASRAGDVAALFPRNGSDVGSLIEIELRYYHGMLNHCCSPRSVLGADGRIDIDRLSKLLNDCWGGAGAFFKPGNRALLQQALDACPEIHTSDRAYALFLLFVCMHIFARADIGQAGTLDGHGAWLDALTREAKRAAVPDIEAMYRKKYGATDCSNGVVRLPLFEGGDLPGPLEIVRLEPLNDRIRAFELCYGVRRASEPGRPLYALRAGGRFAAFLPEAFRSPDAAMERVAGKPGALALTRNGERLEIAIPGPGLPASWAYLPASDTRQEGVVCARDDRALLVTGDARFPGLPERAVQVCAAGVALYALRPDGTVYSNMAGADQLRDIIFMEAGLNHALFVDAARNLWALGASGRIAPVAGVSGIVDVRRGVDDSFALVDRNGFEMTLKL